MQGKSHVENPHKKVFVLSWFVLASMGYAVGQANPAETYEFRRIDCPPTASETFRVCRETALARRSAWLKKAEAYKPKLFRREVTPVRLVKVVPDKTAFQGWRTEPNGEVSSALRRMLKRGDAFIFDFGEHLVGSVAFRFVGFENAMDAPMRLKFTFAEVPLELIEDEPASADWRGLSLAWIQRETFTFDNVPSEVKLPRRYAFRYMKVEVIASTPSGKFGLDDVKAIAETSADERNLRPWHAPSPEVAKMEEIARRTLRDCMQTVFEDGPKRDRRLWLGDLRLEALANYETYRNFEIVKRSLYLLAGTADDTGLVHSDAYERPTIKRGGCRILEYAAFLAVTVLEYLEASGDRETAEDLWPLCVAQLDLLLNTIGTDGVFRPVSKEWWYFIDHCKVLDRQAAEQGALAFGFRKTLELGRKLGHEDDVLFLADILSRMARGASERLWNEERGMYVCEKDGQASYLGQAWIVLGGLADGNRMARCMKTVMADAQAVRPVSPYGHHYFTEALYVAGLPREAAAHMKSYWGRMVDLGADTFWEVFVPEDERASPYRTPLLNSYCHAWSCAPAYFLRSTKYAQ